MSGAFAGLKQVVEIARPHTMKRLLEAGALDLKAPLAVTGALPWLLGRGPSLGIVSHMHAITMRGKPALIDEQGTLTWGELDHEANCVARGLARAGVAPGDKVALLLRNSREVVLTMLATQKLGVVCCPLNTWAKPKELTAIVANVQPMMLVYDTAHADQVRAAFPDDVPLVHTGADEDAVAGSVRFADLVEGCSGKPLAPLTRSRGVPKIVIQTSGTTGTPKGASRDISTSGLGAIANLLDTIPYRRDDVVVCPAPLFHSFGLATLSFAAALGSTIVLPRSFDPEGTLRLIADHRATVASLVPVMIRRIVSLPDEVRARYDLSSLRIVLASGSALSNDLKQAAIKTFGEVLYDLYGSTEIGWVAIARPQDMKERPHTVGKPATGVEVAIFDRSGRRVAPGEIGEIHVRSDFLFEGYTSGDSKASREGYVTIGDLGRFDEDGFLYVESRSDDMVVIGGENVYPIEIEDLIESLPGVREVSVLGVPDPEFGHVLVAFVVGDVTPEEVSELCRAELASYKVPRRIEIRAELPRTATGKVLKRELA